MKQKKQETNDLIASKEAKGIGESHGKSTVEGHLIYERTVEVRQDELIELLGNALSEVDSNILTSIYETEKGREDSIELAECLIKAYNSKIASKRATDLNNLTNRALREIKKKALEDPNKFAKRGYVEEFINDICGYEEFYFYEGIKIKRGTIRNKITELRKDGILPKTKKKTK